MTQAEWLEELIAQIESHGASIVRCVLDDTGHTIEIMNVVYEDGEIKVTLG